MVVSELSPEEELKHVLEEVNIEPSAPENWISYPRAFAYDRTRFDLPINKDKLNGEQYWQYSEIALSYCCKYCDHVQC